MSFNQGINHYRISLIMLLGGILPIIEYILGVFSNSPSLTNLYIFQLFFFFGLSYVQTVKRLGYFHSFSLLHVTTFIFVCGGIAVSPFIPTADFRYTYSPLEMSFPEEIIQKALLLFNIYVVFSFISFFHFFKNRVFINIDRDKHIPFNTNKLYYAIGSKVMLTLIPFALIYGYYMYIAFNQNRTMLLLAGGSSTSVPLYLRLTNLLYTVGYYFVIASTPNKKLFIRYSLLYIISLIPILMMGERGDIVVPIIFMIWYFNRVYNINIKILRAGIIAIIIIIGSYVISFTRLGEDVTGSIFFLFLGFFAQSSTSFKLMSYYISFKDQVLEHNYPFFLDSLIGGLTGAYGQSLETLAVRASIGHHLVYTLNPNYYLSGASTGTAFVVEAFEFGIIGILLSTIVLGYSLNYFENKMFTSRFRMLFVYYIFSLIILSPRGGLLPSLYDLVKISIVSYILILLFKFISVQKIFDKTQANY